MIPSPVQICIRFKSDITEYEVAVQLESTRFDV